MTAHDSQTSGPILHQQSGARRSAHSYFGTVSVAFTSQNAYQSGNGRWFSHQ